MSALLLERRIRDNKWRRVLALPLDPIEYCKKWVALDPDERGYREECIKALMLATGCVRRTAERWLVDPSKCEATAKMALRSRDALNQIHKLSELPPDLEE